MKNIILSLFLFVMYAIQGYAIHFKHLGVEDQLAHPSVLAIAQDSLGRMWFGTENGVSVYDGIRVHSYKPFQKISGDVFFEGVFVSQIVCNQSGDVFFATPQELVKYDVRQDCFSIVSKEKFTALSFCRNTLYTVSFNKLYAYHPQTGEMEYQMTFPVKRVNKLHIDGKGNTWLSADDGLYLLDAEGRFSCLVQGEFVSIFESSAHEIWAGSRNKGLVRVSASRQVQVYNPKNSSEKGLHSANVRQIAEDAEGNIWFGTFKGLFKLDMRTGMFTSFVPAEETGTLPHSSVYAVLLDEDGILWTGVYYGGVNYADVAQDSYRYYAASNMPNSLNHPVVGQMAEDADGNIWICTEGGGLNQLEIATKRMVHLDNTEAVHPIASANLKSLFYDHRQQQLYLGINLNGFYSFSLHDHRVSRFYSETIKFDSLRAVNAIKGCGDSLFISTNRGVICYDILKDCSIPFYSWGGSRFSYIHITPSKELVLLEDSMKIFDLTTFKQKSSYALPVHAIRLCQWDEHTFYIGTYGNGIWKMDRRTGTFSPFPLKSSALLNDNCYQIAKTAKGNLVSIGDKGLSVLSPKGEILEFYGAGSVLPLTSFTRDSGLLVASDGTIYVGGVNGLMSFREVEEAESHTKEHLYFSDIYVYNERIEPVKRPDILSSSLPFAREIVLRHDENRIEVHFASSRDITRAGQSVYEYRLSGIDRYWNQTNENAITYTNLPSGCYTLQLRKQRQEAALQDVSILKITICAPWYYTWWAWTIWIGLAAVLVTIVVRTFQVRKKAGKLLYEEKMERDKMQEINEAKLRFFTSVSHEFRTPLTLIMGGIEQLVHNYKLPPLIYNKVVKIMRQSEQLNNLVTELIEFRKYEQHKVTLKVSPCCVHQFIRQIYDDFKVLAVQNDVCFHLDDNDEAVSVYLDVNQMYKVVYNLLSNAFKFTPCGGRITIGTFVDWEKQSFELSVTDTGCGIAEKDLPYIFERFYQADVDCSLAGQRANVGSGIGLALVKDIVECHKGKIRVESQLGKGASFIVTLKLGKDHFLGDEQVTVIGKTSVLEPLLLQMPVGVSDDTDVEETADEKVESDKPMILLVEDNREVMEVVREIFLPLYQVETAFDGSQGWEKVVALKPDLVVSDVMMPNMSGTDLCFKIKNDIQLCHIPVVLLTALNLPEQNLEGLLRGADDYISKPFNAQILLAKCNNIVRSRRLLYQQLARETDADMKHLATSQPDKDFLEQVTDIIEQNVTNLDFKVDMIASSLCMGRSSFYAKFKELIGVTPNEYINSYRLKKAALWLVHDETKNISEIADVLGFGSPNYFCRKFKECYGVSPTQYRQRNKMM